MSSNLDIDGVPSLNGLHVLVVEDDEATRYAWRSYLAGAGATVTVAATGSAALRVLGMASVDVLVADLKLVGMTGLEIVAHRSMMRPLARPVVAIAVTAYPELRAEALGGGFVAFLEKPVEPRDLIEEIARRARP